MKPIPTLILLLVYFALCVGMVSYIPIAWIDEAMFADVARNLAQNGSFSSKLWDLPQANQFLLGHMPLWQLLLAVWYKIFPTTLFYTRLPGLLLYMGFGLLSWFYFRKHLGPETAGILTLLCIGDKALFEAARSVRMDMLGAFLLMAIATGEQWKWNRYLLSGLCGLLALVHPNFWFAAGLLWVYLFIENKRDLKLFIPVLIPLMAYLLWIFPWMHLIQPQLLAHTGEHLQTKSFWMEQALDYFLVRFGRWYEIQAYTPILYFASLLAGLVLFPGVKPIRKWVILLWIQTIFLIAIAGPYPRYNLPVIVIVWVMLPWLLLKVPGMSGGKKIPVWTTTLVVILSFYPFLSRGIVAAYQQEERDPERVLGWIRKELPEKQKTLLVDEAIGYYVQQASVDFALIHTKDQFTFSDYPGGVYWLTYSDTVLTDMTKAGEYQCALVKLPSWIPMRQTYQGLKLYRIESERAWNQLQP